MFVSNPTIRHDSFEYRVIVIINLDEIFSQNGVFDIIHVTYFCFMREYTKKSSGHQPLYYLIVIDFGLASAEWGMVRINNPLTISAVDFVRLNLREIFQPKLKLLFLIPEW